MNNLELSHPHHVYPFVNELVDSLYTDEINLLIDSDNVQVDKKTFLMFIIMYFATRLYASDKTLSKEDIKIFLTDMIRNPSKRTKCIDIFLLFERNLNDTLNFPGKALLD